MRTSVVLSPALMKRAKRFIKKRNMTFRQLVETAIERMLQEQAPTQDFVLEDAAFCGELGFQAGVGPRDVSKMLSTMNEARATIEPSS